MEQPIRKTKVLVVDDHRSFADSLALILNQDGCQATTAYSGEEAVEVAAHLHPDVLISDVVMGGMTGIEAAVLIGTMIPGCDILLVSGQLQTADLLERARVAGHQFEVLAKPVHPETILQRVNRREGPGTKPAN
jgi:CheY-like chemotaxis protein